MLCPIIFLQIGIFCLMTFVWNQILSHNFLSQKNPFSDPTGSSVKVQTQGTHRWNCQILKSCPQIWLITLTS